MTSEWLWFAGLGAVAWFWWDSLRKRELTLNAAQRACEQANVQFLDGSVALRKIRMERDDNYRARIYREYAFDYSAQGDDRQSGRVYLLGAQVLSISLIQSAT